MLSRKSWCRLTPASSAAYCCSSQMNSAKLRNISNVDINSAFQKLLKFLRELVLVES